MPFQDSLDGQTYFCNACEQEGRALPITSVHTCGKDYSEDTCTKHNKVDCMECFYTTRAEMPVKDWSEDFNNQFDVEKRCKAGYYPDNFVLFNKARDHDIKSFISTLLAEKDKEIVICSAVKTNTGKIFRGHRHGDCMKAIRERHFAVSGKPEDQGFITSLNRYVNRKDGYDLQIKAGIKSVNPDGYCQVGQLYSEDIY